MRLTEQNVKEVIVDASMKKAVFVYFSWMHLNVRLQQRQ